MSEEVDKILLEKKKAVLEEKQRISRLAAWEQVKWLDKLMIICCTGLIGIVICASTNGYLALIAGSITGGVMCWYFMKGYQQRKYLKQKYSLGKTKLDEAIEEAGSQFKEGPSKDGADKELDDAMEVIEK